MVTAGWLIIIQAHATLSIAILFGFKVQSKTYFLLKLAFHA